MPVLGRRPALALLESGESLLVVTEAAQFSVPRFKVNVESTDRDYYFQDQIYPLGTRLSYSLISYHGRHSFPIPLLCRHKDAEKGAQPIDVFPLHNAVDVSVAYEETTKKVHCMWWWNAWTPDYVETAGPSQPISPPGTPVPPEQLVTVKLPKPPWTFYAAHSAPDPSTPAWLRSLVPKTIPSQFDVTKPFWVAPIPEGYQFDYFPEGTTKESPDNGVIIGESRVNKSMRIPDTPGGRWLQGLIARGLVEYPGPEEAYFTSAPSPERDSWERRGGIVAAGEHIRVASMRDVPEFVPVAGMNPYTREKEMEFLPGVGHMFPPAMTWEDHLTIINALKAHYDYANLVHTTRVLMYAQGTILDNAILTTIPTQVTLPTVNQGYPFRGPWWPAEPESNRGSLVILDYPRVVGAFPNLTNYRTLVYPNKVWYPLQDYPDTGTKYIDDGYLVDGATPHLNQEAGVDWVVSDPCDSASALLDVYRNHLDNRSY